MRPPSEDPFCRVDSELAAYLLGWFACVGPGGAASAAAALAKRGLRLGDARSWLELGAGEPLDHAGFPTLASDELTWAFVRGCFDAKGDVAPPTSGRLTCSFAWGSDRLRAGIRRFTGIPSTDSARGLVWSGSSALDLLAKLYDKGEIWMPSPRDLYLRWASYVPGLSDERRPVFRWSRTDPHAVPPSKERAADSGFDLTLITKVRELGPVTLFGTGIKVEPDDGWYFEVVPRSSIIKTGHTLANCVGVIDRTYRGEILVPLAKLASDVPDLALPARVVQMIPRPIIHPELREVAHLDTTARGEGGFGSTG